MKKEERQSRIIARGEVSGHAHIITGEAIVRNENGEILIEITGKASIRHLLETAWLAGQEHWTEEHMDIDLTDLPKQVRHGDVLLDRIAPKTYKMIGQREYDPYEKHIRAVQD